jgi:hypothetical protein
VALTGGEASDFKGYMPVMDADGPAPKVLLADKGYDGQCQELRVRGGIMGKKETPYGTTQSPCDTG